jgi:hypothetical protein
MQVESELFGIARESWGHGMGGYLTTTPNKPSAKGWRPATGVHAFIIYTIYLKLKRELNY